jgi:hypothetical protein
MVHLPVWHEALAACLPFMAECRVLIPLLLASGKVVRSELFSNRCISPKCCFTIQEDMVQNMWYTRALSTGRKALQKVLSWSALQPDVVPALRVAKECAYKGSYQRRWPQPRVHQIYRRDALNGVFFALFIVLQRRLFSSIQVEPIHSESHGLKEVAGMCECRWICSSNDSACKPINAALHGSQM